MRCSSELQIISILRFIFAGSDCTCPGKDKNLCLLHDPYDFSVPRHSRYRFLSGREPSFPRNEVLNHIYLEKLLRGFPRPEGQLLWDLQAAPIPDEYVSKSTKLPHSLQLSISTGPIHRADSAADANAEGDVSRCSGRDAAAASRERGDR